MNSACLSRSAALTVALSLLAVCFIGRAHGAMATPDDFQKLSSTWAEQESAVVNGKIELHMFRFFDGGAASLTLDRLDHLVDQLKSDIVSEDLARLLDNENTGSWKKENSYLWNVPSIVVFEGNKVKNTFITNKGTITRAYDGSNEVSLDPANRHVRIDPGTSAIEKLSLHDFYVIPPKAYRLALANDTAERTKERPNILTIKYKSSLLVADLETGLISRLIRYDQTGSVTHERRALFPMPGTKNLPLPRLVCNFTIKNKCVEMATLFLIDKVDFNIELPSSEFKVAVPAAHTVFDYRKDPKRPSAVSASTSVEDAVSYADAKLTHEDERKHSPPRRILPWVITTTSVVFLYLVYLRWRKRSQSDDH